MCGHKAGRLKYRGGDGRKKGQLPLTKDGGERNTGRLSKRTWRERGGGVREKDEKMRFL